MGKRLATRKVDEKTDRSPPVEQPDPRRATFARRHAVFLGILAFAAISRLVILFVSQTHVHSDEAIIGLMAKHIQEGRYHPFYMYGQPYNAGASFEAYLAAVTFAAAGVGVLPLKFCILVLSLVCLVLFYGMATRLYGRRTALLACVVFMFFPSLVKWHFQVRGYSPYFLSLPILCSLFLWIDSTTTRHGLWTFLFGLVSGLSMMCLELAMFPVAVLSALLVARRRFSLKTAAMGLLGFIAGYSPAVMYNLTHRFSNWREVFFYKTTSGGNSLLSLESMSRIFADEMPKFFGPDAVLLYYPEKPLAGYLFYAFALAAIVLAIAPYLAAPARIPKAILVRSSESDRDLLMLILTLACFVPYAIAWKRTPSYFLGGCFFLSLLMGRMLARSFTASRPARVAGSIILGIVIVTGLGVMANVGRQKEIETLTYDKSGQLQMSRVANRDLEEVEDHLSREKTSSVWATVSFVYPLIFESNEKLAVSDAIFGTYRPIYPESVPQKLPRPNERTAFVTETNSPALDSVEKGFVQARGAKPATVEFGTLTVIDAPARSH
jgi:4-amino-4-deoxy-L-arabinose transferase-like glycosyltransferase